MLDAQADRVAQAYCTGLIQTLKASYSYFSDCRCIVFFNLAQFSEPNIYIKGRAPYLAPLSYVKFSKFTGAMRDFRDEANILA